MTNEQIRETRMKLEGERDQLVQALQQMQQQFEIAKGRLQSVVGKLELLDEIEGGGDAS